MTIRPLQTGVALITAMLIMALATIAATQLVAENGLSIRRTSNLIAMDQAMLYALGAESWVIEILEQDARESEIDYLGEVWAIPLPPLEVEGGVIQGTVEDMQGRFNINNLVGDDGEANQAALEQFQRLLVLLDLDQKYAALALDWLDPDAQETFPDGAEDSLYTGQEPPYRAANSLVNTTSELSALPEFDYTYYEILKPHIAALPRNTAINVCTASGYVLDSLLKSSQEFSTEEPQSLYEERVEVCYPDLNDMKSRIEAQEQELTSTSESSNYFRLVTRATIGTTQFTLYSLLERGSGGQVRPILRSFGNE